MGPAELTAILAIRILRELQEQRPAGAVAREARDRGIALAPALPVTLIEQAVMDAFRAVARDDDA